MPLLDSVYVLICQVRVTVLFFMPMESGKGDVKQCMKKRKAHLCVEVLIMKKGLSILLLVMLLTNIGITSVMGASDAAVFRLQSLGIIGEYIAEHNVTRAEAAGGFIKLLIDDAFYNSVTPFSDIPESHKYAGEINYASGIGIVNGVSEGIFSPDTPITGMQLIKMAVVTLGYKSVAEAEGGYEEGYKSTAMKQRLMTGFPLYENVTMFDFVTLLNKILDLYPLEAVYGTDRYEISKETMYEKILKRSEMANIKEGILTAAGTSVLNGYDELLEDEVSIDGTRFKYFGKNPYEFLGKSVTAYYKEDEFTGKTVIINILPKSNNNEEISIKNKDIKTLTTTECVFDISDTRTKNIKISPSATFIYNRINYIPASADININTGDIRLLDSNYDSVYDVVFIDEYESYVIDRISQINTAVYFKKNVLFRGKSYFKFDFLDVDKKYYIYDDDNTAIKLEDIKASSVITFISSMDEKINYITVSDKKAHGMIEGISIIENKGESEIIINGEIYTAYKPNEAEIFADYKVGNTAAFYLNNRNEIVGGDLSVDGLYGYVMDAATQKNLNGSIKIRIIPSGISEKEIEVVGDTEVIKYNYQNGEEIILDIASRVKYTGRLTDGRNVIELSVSDSEIDLNFLKGSVVRYKLNSAGEANLIDAVSVNLNALKAAPKYDFNAKVNSFGGLSSAPPFLIGNNTNVICIPAEDNPIEDDYEVSVSIADKTTQTVLGINIDKKTQIAECALLVTGMNAADAKPFSDTTKYSIVGKVSQAISEEGEDIYKLEILTGSSYKVYSVRKTSPRASVVAGLRCGDIIRYNTQAAGEISNIKKFASMYEYTNNYGENLDGTVFGRVSDIELNRLDALLNIMLDEVIFEHGVLKYKLPRQDGPQVYSYKKSGGVISVAETDEIMEGAEVFLFAPNGSDDVKAVVVFK